MKKIHINCDLGEGGEKDAEIMSLVSACNIACGGHAGTLETMQHTVDLALANGVEIGAHPSFPDKENFGRKEMQIPEKDLRRSLVAQILSLKQICEAEGGVLKHVKPHGALYNKAQHDGKISAVILSALEEFDAPLTLYAPEGSVIAKMAEGKVQVRFEAFADRRYNPDGSLVSRKEDDALITEKEEVAEHLFSMVNDRRILCKNGEKISTRASTFCLHSDTPNAENILRYLHEKPRNFPFEIERGNVS